MSGAAFRGPAARALYRARSEPLTLSDTTGANPRSLHAAVRHKGDLSETGEAVRSVQITFRRADVSGLALEYMRVTLDSGERLIIQSAYDLAARGNSGYVRAICEG